MIWGTWFFSFGTMDSHRKVSSQRLYKLLDMGNTQETCHMPRWILPASRIQFSSHSAQILSYDLGSMSILPIREPAAGSRRLGTSAMQLNSGELLHFAYWSHFHNWDGFCHSCISGTLFTPHMRPKSSENGVRASDEIRCALLQDRSG
jgi:hypothetical protein